MVRRSIAGGAALIALVLFLLLLRGCLDSRKEQSFRDYTREVAALTGESDDQSAGVFRLLTGNAGEVETTTQLNAFAGNADQLLERARGTGRPDELAEANDYLIETLQFRRDGIRAVARLLPGENASRAERRQSAEGIAAAMQTFLASDVIYTTRVRPRLEGGLKEQDLDGEIDVPQSAYLPDTGWLDPDTVTDRVGALGGGGSGGADGEAAPGLHGNGLETVTLGGVALTPDASASVPLDGNLTFEIQVVNQGENTETDVDVNVTVGSGGDATELSETLPEIAAGETATVEVPFDAEPPTGQNVAIAVEVAAVPGEEMTDNNVGEFSVIFTR